MLAMIISAAFASHVAAMSGPCQGDDLAIVSAKPFGVVTDRNGLTTYGIAVVVRNLGEGGQPPNALDSVEMFVDGAKSDVKALNPLAPGEKRRLVFTVQRNVDAARGSTALRFSIVPPDSCNSANDTIEMTL